MFGAYDLGEKLLETDFAIPSKLVEKPALEWRAIFGGGHGHGGIPIRESYQEPTLIEPGRIYKFEISLWETSNVFKTGHSIRVEASSSNFPRFDRNLNTGHILGFDSEMEVARQTIYHSSPYPSHIFLPVIPR